MKVSASVFALAIGALATTQSAAALDKSNVAFSNGVALHASLTDKGAVEVTDSEKQQASANIRASNREEASRASILLSGEEENKQLAKDCEERIEKAKDEGKAFKWAVEDCLKVKCKGKADDKIAQCIKEECMGQSSKINDKEFFSNKDAICNFLAHDKNGKDGKCCAAYKKGLVLDKSAAETFGAMCDTCKVERPVSDLQHCAAIWPDLQPKSGKKLKDKLEGTDFEGDFMFCAALKTDHGMPCCRHAMFFGSFGEGDLNAERTSVAKACFPCKVTITSGANHIAGMGVAVAIAVASMLF